MEPRRIRLFVKTHCPWCREAQAWLSRHGIAYDALDVMVDPAAFDEMVRLSGQSRAPVIDVDGRVLADFGADEIAVWWPRHIGPLQSVG